MADSGKVPFTAVIDALLDDRAPFPPIHLRRFSDISPVDLKALIQIWLLVSVDRRRSLLEDLEGYLDADTTVSFHDFSSYCLKDPDPQVRLYAIRLLEEEDDTSLMHIFIRMMQNDEDHLVRAGAASGLSTYVYDGELEEIPARYLHEAEDRLIEVVNGKDVAEVRRRALEALGFSSRPEVPGLIEAAYQEGSQDWLASTLFAMGRSADQRWKREVLEKLDHPSAVVRLEAIRAAGELEIKSALQTLMRTAVNDDDFDVRRAAIWSLSQLGGDQVQRLLDRMLEKAGEDEEIEFLEDALENLSFTNDMEFFELIEVDEDVLQQQEETLDDIEEEE